MALNFKNKKNDVNPLVKEYLEIEDYVVSKIDPNKLSIIPLLKCFKNLNKNETLITLQTGKKYSEGFKICLGNNDSAENSLTNEIKFKIGNFTDNAKKLFTNNPMSLAEIALKDSEALSKSVFVGYVKFACQFIEAADQSKSLNVFNFINEEVEGGSATFFKIDSASISTANSALSIASHICEKIELIPTTQDEKIQKVADGLGAILELVDEPFSLLNLINPNQLQLPGTCDTNDHEC